MTTQSPLSSQQRVGIIPALKADRQSNTWHTVKFDPPFPQDTQVAVIPMTQTYNGHETPGLRLRHVTPEGFEIRFDEVVAQGRSADGAHLDEAVAWIAYPVSTQEEDTQGTPGTPGTPGVPTFPPESLDITADTIYQLLWEHDENQFSVSPRNSSGDWENPEADILLDEQVKAAGKREIDLATHPLFYEVNEAKLFDKDRTINMQGNVIAKLFKPKGGFFVDPSPECEMAMATVAYYESVHGKITDKRRITINDATYNLVLYRSTNPNGSRGEFIRSFFPIFLAMDDGETPDNDEPVVEPIDEVTNNNGDVVIFATQPNPEGSDEGNEWVELKNTTSNPIDLSGWKLQDKLDRPEDISGTLQPQEVKRFTISRANYTTMQLGNSSGIIALINAAGQEVAMVSYGSASSGEVIRFVS